MEVLSLEPFLKIGITLAIFSLSGCWPVLKEWLAILAKGGAIVNFISWIMLGGILVGPVAFPFLKYEIIFTILFSSVGVKNNEFGLGL